MRPDELTNQTIKWSGNTERGRKTMRKRTAKLILLLMLVGVVLTGCSTSKATNPLYAMLRMPDGSIIQGVCNDYKISYGCVRVVIDGTSYVTGIGNVLIWREW